MSTFTNICLFVYTYLGTKSKQLDRTSLGGREGILVLSHSMYCCYQEEPSGLVLRPLRFKWTITVSCRLSNRIMWWVPAVFIKGHLHMALCISCQITNLFWLNDKLNTQREINVSGVSEVIKLNCAIVSAL